MYKRAAAFAALLFSVFVLVGCGKGASQKTYSDDAFYSSLEKGLHNRWKLSDKHDKSGKDATATSMGGYFDAELKQINKYKSKSFKSKKLGALAKHYIAALNTQKKLLPDFEDNSEESVVAWDKAAINRSETLLKINEHKKLKFTSAKDKRDWKSIPEGLAENQDYVKTSADTASMVHNAKFNLTENLDGYKTYQAVIQNTTPHNFTYFDVDVKLIDSKGVTVETDTASTQDWNKDSKVQFEFNTDKDFDHYELSRGDYDYDD